MGYKIRALNSFFLGTPEPTVTWFKDSAALTVSKINSVLSYASAAADIPPQTSHISVDTQGTLLIKGNNNNKLFLRQILTPFYDTTPFYNTS